MADLKEQTEAVMRAITQLSNDAKAAGDGDLMYAANRAWTQLYNHQTVSLKAHIVAYSLSNGER